MGTKLDRISELSAKNPQMKFNSMYHLINEELLKECHKELDGKKATGAYKDKLVQSALKRILEAVYEPKLRKSMHKL